LAFCTKDNSVKTTALLSKTSCDGAADEATEPTEPTAEEADTDTEEAAEAPGYSS